MGSSQSSARVGSFEVSGVRFRGLGDFSLLLWQGRSPHLGDQVKGLGFRRLHSDNPGEACGLGFRALGFRRGIGSGG